MSGAQGGEAHGVTLVARSLTYTVSTRGKGGHLKCILNEVDFIANPGQLMVIMGPSGSGKTTLLNALADRLRKRSNTKLSGDILCDGYNAREIVRKISNYVMQNDQLLEFLSVRETLTFAARLRLPDLSEAERQARAMRVAQELGLLSCLDVRVGGSESKGLSGGQKKRLSVAIELLDDPRLLFLDEPTSGLDSSLAYDTLRVLLNVAKRGRTVIATVHQPRSQVFALFDQLMLLSEGKIVFQGRAQDSETYFASIGHACPPHFNPADFYLDLVSVDNRVEPGDDDFTVALDNDRQAQTKNVELMHVNNSPEETTLELPTGAVLAVATQQSSSLIPSNAHSQTLPAHPAAPTAPSRFDSKASSSMVVSGRVIIDAEEVARLPDMFRTSMYGQALQDAIEKGSQKKDTMTSPLSRRSKFTRQSHAAWWRSVKLWFTAIRVLTHRTFLNNWRNPMATYVQFIVCISYGLIIGSLYFRFSRDTTTRDASQTLVMNILGLLFFVATQYAFSNMESLLAFPKERIVFNRDTANGLYAPSAFFLAKNFADILFQHAPLMCFALISYFMTGVGPSVGQCIVYVFIGMVMTFSAASFLYMIGAGIYSYSAAVVVAPAGEVFFMLLSGYFLKDESIPRWIAWLKYVNYIRYGFFAFVQNEFPVGEAIGVGDGRITNEFILTSLARIPSSLTLWENLAACFGLGCLFRFIAFLFLKYLHRGIGVEA